MVFGWFKRAKPTASTNPYDGLRDLIFSTDPSKLPLDSSLAESDVVGVLMEATAGNAVYTLVSLGDGTTSLYYSTGGGVLGAGEHEAVALSTRRFIGLAQEYIDQMRPTKTYPGPQAGHVRFYLIARSGKRTVEVKEQDLRQGQSEFARLYKAAHEVIANVRICSEARLGGAEPQ